MDLSKIKTLIDFVGQSNVTELAVTEKDTTVRIFRMCPSSSGMTSSDATPAAPIPAEIPAPVTAAISIQAPIFGVLHAAPGPGEDAFINAGDTVEAGQTLFIVEAMKVFNPIVAPRAGRILRITAVDGSEVEAGDMLAEIT